MRAFSQLLDDLVYTRSRLTKLTLIGDYLRATPDPDRGLALAALTGTLDLPAVKPAVVRALAEERIDPVLLAMSRDYVGDMAETVSLLWPVPEGEPVDLDDGTIRLSQAVGGRAVSERCASVLATMLDRLDRRGRYALLKLATGAMRVGISARLAKQALADAFVDVEDGRGGLARAKPPYAELFAWGDGRSRSRPPRTCRLFRPFMLAHPLDETRVEPRRLCGRVEVGRDPHPAGPRRRADAALFAHRRRHQRQLSRSRGGLRYPRGARRRIAGARARARAAEAQAGRRQASTRSSSGSGARRVGQGDARDYPAFVRLYDMLFDGEDDLRALPWAERRARLEALVATLDPDRFDLSPLVEADQLRAARGNARRRPRRGDRGDDAQAARFALCRRAQGRPVVQVETRPPDRGLRADVCPARVTANAPAITATSPSAAGRDERASCFRSARPISASPTRSSKMLDHFVRNNTAQSLRPGARGREEPGARSGVRFDPRQQAPQVGAGDALSADQPDPHRQARGRGGSVETLLAMAT